MSSQVTGAAPRSICSLAFVAFLLGGCRHGSYAPVQVTEPAPPLREGGADSSLAGRRGSVDLDDVAREAARDAALSGLEEDGTDEAQREVSLTDAALERDAKALIDAWHGAAAVGDRDRYVGYFTMDAVFMGTDENERWDLATFSAYVDEHFKPGSGWELKATERHVMLSPSRDAAWFDERLTNPAGFGALRGTGVLRRVDDTWKIARYSMAITIPNEVRGAVMGVVREAAR